MKFGPETNSKPHIWTRVELAKFNQPEPGSSKIMKQ